MKSILRLNYNKRPDLNDSEKYTYLKYSFKEKHHCSNGDEYPHLKNDG